MRSGIPNGFTLAPLLIVPISEDKPFIAKGRPMTHASQPRQVLEDIVRAFGKTVEKVEPYTAGHHLETARFAVILAGRLGFSAAAIDLVRLGAALHDVGKIALPPSLLLRPGKLSPAEYGVIQDHPRLGWEILSEIKLALPVATVILQHHERLDGSGYPQGLSSEAILAEAMITAVADKAQALIAHRPYQPAMDQAMVTRLMAEDHGTRLPGPYVDAAIDMLRGGGWLH
jgi:putative nucleotidyltransferase with HDIG domain